MSDPTGNEHDQPNDDTQEKVSGDAAMHADIPENARDVISDETTDDEGKPLENPSGG